MKRNILLILFFLISASNFGQKIPFWISKSNIFQDEYKNSVIVLSETNSKGELLLVRSYKGTMLSQGEGFYIEKYDDNFKLQRAFDFELKHPNYQKYNLIIGIFSMQNNIHFVEIYYDLNEKSFICLDNIMSEDFKNTRNELFRLSKEEMASFGTFNLQQKFYDREKETWTNDNLGIINSENELANLNTFHRIFFSSGGTQNNMSYTNVFDNENKSSGSDILLTVNETKTAFAIVIDTNNKENDGLKLYLFDNNLDKKMDRFYTNEVNDKKCFFQNVQVSPTGDAIYLLAKAYTKDLKKKEEGGKYYYEFSKISEEKIATQKVDTKEHFIGSLKTYFHNNELITIGFYSDARDYRYSGICCFKSDANTLELKASNYNPFTPQFLLDKYGNENTKALKSITFKKLFFTDNNEIILNAEESYITEKYYASTIAPGMNLGYSGGSSIHYNYDDIIIAKLKNDGSLLWARNINKKQATIDDDNSFISYTSTIKNGNNYFFINTKDKIKKLKNDQIEFGQIRKNKSNLNIIQVDANGNFEYEEILDDEENAVPFMVSKGVIIDNSVYFLGRRGNNKQLLKVTL